jgi:SAM-dependent methyltransferase
MLAAFEIVGCPICGSSEQMPRYALPDLAYYTAGTFHLVTCRACGCLYQSPRPTQTAVKDYYPGDYEPHRKAIEEQTGYSALRWLKHMQLRTRCLQVSRLRPTGRLLDVGCSTGLFLNEMRRYGAWELVGVETDALATQYGRERFGLMIHEGQVEDFSWSGAPFDVITLWDVLEHLPNPGAALRRLRDLLAPGGHLIVSVPNLDSVDARVFGPWWTGLDPPRHFSVFRSCDITRLLQASDLSVRRTYCFYGRYTTFAASLKLVLRSSLKNATLRRLLERCIGLSIWRYATWPYFAVIDRLGRGAILTVVATRP